MMDGEFEKVKSHLNNVVINTTAAKEHVGEIERVIRIIEERARGIIATLPFKFIPRQMLIELMSHVVMWLNAFPAKAGISEIYSSREIVLRHRLDYSKHCKVQFGTYCEVFDQPEPSNSMTARTHEAIALGPTGNLQGTQKFFLRTGLVLKRMQFTALPMPDSVIDRVNDWGSKNNQEGTSLVFADRH